MSGFFSRLFHRSPGPNKRATCKPLLEALEERCCPASSGIDGYDLGVRSPVVFGSSRTQGLDDVYYVRVEGGRFVTVTDWQAWAK